MTAPQTSRPGEGLICCGTYAGYQRHRRRGEPTCAPCRDAATDYQALRRVRRGEASSRGLRMQLAGWATDVDDAAHLLDDLDLLDTSLSTGNPQRHPQGAPVSVWPLRAGRPPRTGGRR